MDIVKTNVSFTFSSDIKQDFQCNQNHNQNSAFIIYTFKMH